MKKLNKKGFTLVELVIVIAVIAILAAVLIPTFSNVINKANESAAMQKATAAYTNWLAKEVSATHKAAGFVGDFNMTAKNGTASLADSVAVSSDGMIFERNADGKWEHVSAKTKAYLLYVDGSDLSETDLSETDPNASASAD